MMVLEKEHQRLIMLNVLVVVWHVLHVMIVHRDWFDRVGHPDVESCGAAQKTVRRAMPDRRSRGTG